MDIERGRRKNGTLDLIKLFTRDGTLRLSSEAEDFLEDVEIFHPIKSRQVAAVALATAKFIARLKINSPLPDH